MDQVRAKIAALRQQAAEGGKSQAYDFEARIRQIAEQHDREKQERKAAKKSAKEAAKEKQKTEMQMDVDEAAMSVMGFGGFGSTKKR